APPLVIPLGRRCMDQRKICSAALKAGSWRRSLQLLQEAEAAQVPLNLRVYTALIGACRSRWQAAIHLLRRLQGEQQEGKRWQLAFGLLEELDCAGIER
ncbi:unnamed protein product, partial [Effrenium voratum]